MFIYPVQTDQASCNDSIEADQKLGSQWVTWPITECGKTQQIMVAHRTLQMILKQNDSDDNQISRA